MTAGEWAVLIPAVAAFLAGAGVWLKLRAHTNDPTAHTVRKP